jgi:hypothetical protein
MTSASPGPGPDLFSILSISRDNDRIYRTRREAFVVSLLGQAAILGLLIYFMSCVIQQPPGIVDRLPRFSDLPLVFSGHNGGGGGNRDPLPASHGNLPRASLDPQLAPPTVMLPKEMPKLAVEETVMVAPDVKLPQGGQIGDPTSQFLKALSNGPGGPGGIGSGSWTSGNLSGGQDGRVRAAGDI